MSANGTANPSVEWSRDQLRQLWLFDVSEKQHVLRAAMAKGFGLDPIMFARPFPGSTPNEVTIVSTEAPTPAPAPAQSVASAPAAPVVAAVAPSLLARVLPWVLATAMGAGGLGWIASALLAPHSTTPTAATPSPTPAVVAPAQKPQEWEIKYKVGPDGKWQTQVAPVAPESP